MIPPASGSRAVLFSRGSQSLVDSVKPKESENVAADMVAEDGAEVAKRSKSSRQVKPLRPHEKPGAVRTLTPEEIAAAYPDGYTVPPEKAAQQRRRDYGADSAT